MVRIAQDWTCANFIIMMKNVTVQGFPCGCLKACAGSDGHQYSSSHSMGGSTSYLRQIKTCQ